MLKQNNLKKKIHPNFNESHKNANSAWDKDNQAWWDWYVSLADNSNLNVNNALLELPEPPKVKYPSKISLKKLLSSPYNLTKHDIKTFQKNGFIKLKNVFTPGALQVLRHEILTLLRKTFTNYYEMKKNRFLSLEMMWVHFPLETNDVITAWIPAQAIPIEMGPLMFAKPIEVYKLVKDIEFNESDTSYDKKISDIFKKEEVSIVEEPFELGEVSFHHNLSFHTASENKTTQSRIVLANTYFADGARVVNNPTMISGDWKKFIPETKPGQIVSSKFNPVCWPAINQI